MLACHCELVTIIVLTAHFFLFDIITCSSMPSLLAKVTVHCNQVIVVSKPLV